MNHSSESSTIVELSSSDIALILPLNNTHVAETSLLDHDSLCALLEIAFFARGVAGGAVAFLIALDQNAAYDNPNFNWFKARRESFVYIDRIIVSAEARGQGLASRLYEELFAAASRAGHRRVVCEVNIAPPNPASLAFHAAIGFTAVGEAAIHNGSKSVRYLEKLL
jgi:predicted GNAT superfamily acetyltransferase